MDNEEQVEMVPKDIIKHIVISGGGIIGFSHYGVLRESNKRGMWAIENIESIYGTSVGSLLAIFISLNFDWSVLDDYIIKRPWHNVINFTMYSIIQSIESRGILNIKIFEEIFEPLFLSKNIDINITLKELYELTHIDIHIFATELNTFKLIDLCHSDYQEWRVIDAVYASCCVPLLFTPLIKDSCCYLDGGFLLNYPMSECIRQGKNVNEIFGICQEMDKIHSLHIQEESTLFDYIFALLNKIVLNIFNVYTHEHLKYEIKINTVKMGLYAIFDFASSKDKRIEMIDLGVNQCIEYFDSIQQP